MHINDLLQNLAPQHIQQITSDEFIHDVKFVGVGDGEPMTFKYQYKYPGPNRSYLKTITLVYNKFHSRIDVMATARFPLETSPPSGTAAEP